MARQTVRPQLLIAWIPVGALFIVLIMSAHRGVAAADAVMIAARMVVAGALLGVPVFRLTRRLPWPEPMTPAFVVTQLVAATTFAVLFVTLNSVLESMVRRELIVTIGGAGLGAFIVMGMLIYCMIAGVSYATVAAERVAVAETAAARAQLSALRAQLNPHFLFNALHTVVQLIPRDPARAARAAEEVAGLLRTTIEENRDVVTLDEELAFARRYLGVERMRFGERLIVEEAVSDEALDAEVPVFAVQTLIENAVRHGAAPSVEPTTVSIIAEASNGRLTITVRDNGAGASANAPQSTGTGLRRLRERLAAIYGGRARLEAQPLASGGFVASHTLPLDGARA
jgi:hypothetical protein